ncbi:MAG: hypothetical protein PVSMB6_04510 [Steroidobacteraceae bacterium]
MAVGATGLLMFAAAAWIAACASTPPAPTASLQAARLAIANAEQADASRYAGEQLAEARIRLASADTAVKEQRMVMAERLADESRADAELASAKTGAVKAAAVNAEMAHSTKTLVEEMQRGAGDKP